jgi:carbonic anhydrase
MSCNSKPVESAEVANEVQSKKRSDRPVHWGYSGETGPEKWSKLSPAYALCDSGKSQSPINIIKTNEREGMTWKLDYKSTSFRIAHNDHVDDIIDNGHTIQISVDSGSTFTFGDKLYYLKQFHFHTPSEHTLDGERFPMEMHFVHQASDGSLAVVGVLFKEGKVVNENFSMIIRNLPDAKGEVKHFTDSNLELKLHVPKVNFAYHYVGSLTTPPCSENVQWLVLRDMISLTAEQIKAFSSRIGPNNRPTQQVNGRTVKIDDLVGQLDK